MGSVPTQNRERLGEGPLHHHRCHVVGVAELVEGAGCDSLDLDLRSGGVRCQSDIGTSRSSIEAGSIEKGDGLHR